MAFNNCPHALGTVCALGHEIDSTDSRCYIAGLLLPPTTGLDNILLGPPPRAMEYRIATRRISSRGFAGTLLLQAEMGSGQRAPYNAIAALAQMKSKLQGALTQGDQFRIVLTEEEHTVFSLNHIELARIEDGSIFDFFFAGWVGDTSSAIFRDALLAGRPDENVAARFNSLQPAEQRVATVERWIEPAPEPKPVIVAAPQPEPVVVATAKVADLKPVVVATTRLAPPPPAEPQLDDREYQRRLNDYVGEIMVRVFGEVVYPRRAIKRTLEGRVELLARMDAKGGLLDLAVGQSSGSTLLDRAAERAVRKAAPFPEPSDVAREEFAADDGSYLMPIPITFRKN